MNKKLWSTVMLSFLIPSLLISSTNAATSSEQKVAPDGTIILDKYPIDPQHQAMINEKQKLATLHYEAKIGKRSKDDVKKTVDAFYEKHGFLKKTNQKPANYATTDKAMTTTVVTTSSLSNNYLWNLYQQSQINGYYCGPATASEILKEGNYNVDQSTAAGLLGTTSDGTAWYNGTYPMRDTLNTYYPNNYYTVQAGGANFKSNLVFDIDYGYGIAGDVVEYANDKHLTGHPINQTIYHWVALDGYYNYGDNTHYADSASGGVGISWGSSVPKYSDLPTTDFAYLVKDRGTIW